MSFEVEILRPPAALRWWLTLMACHLHVVSGFTQTQNLQIREEWITLSDGIRLSLDWYLPSSLDSTSQLPVILEYLPYRKMEGRRNRYGVFSYFVKSEYLVVRVDIRGTGNSEGQLIEYEYSDQELEDALEVIQWLSQHPYCNGEVVMMGISWGGFNALQVAMLKPPELKAIVTLMSTDDLYQDDVHYIDGVMHIDAYEIGQDLSNVLPGAPEFTIDSAYFTDRFDSDPWLLTYKRQQRDGPFWNRASVNEDYTAIDVPVFAIGGLFDGYRDFIPRYMKEADVPLTAIIGPWNHTFPNWADPPPAIEWRRAVVDWLNCHVKKNCIQIPPEKSLFVFQRDWHPPGYELPEIVGYWRNLAEWPPRSASRDTLFLHADYSLSTGAGDSVSQHFLKYKASAGIEASGSVMWWGDWAPDQSETDQHSLTYVSEPLKEDLEIMGFPIVHLQTSCDTALAHWVVRLSNESPQGQVTLVTGAAFNGSHRNSAEEPAFLKPDVSFGLEISMHFTSWTFRKGHRIRLAVNNAQWPMLWPTPYPLTMTLYLGDSNETYLQLPVMPHDPDPAISFDPPEEDPELTGYQTLHSGTNSGFAELALVCYDHQTKMNEIIASNSSEEAYPWGTMFYNEEIRHLTNDEHPERTSVISDYTIRAMLPERNLRWEGQLNFSGDADNFYYHYTRQLFVNQILIKDKTWMETIPRDHH